MKVSTVKTLLGEMTIIDNGKVRLGFTCDRGMRISHISYLSSDNLCFCDDNDEEKTVLDDGTVWHSHGGHRLWKSPEDTNCYVGDNDKCTLSVNAHGVKMVSPLNRQGLVLSITAEFESANDSQVTITHTITNRSEKALTIGAWGITSLKREGIATMYIDQSTIGLQPNRNIVLWPYTDIYDQRIAVNQGRITITGKSDPSPLKIGTYSNVGIIDYLYDGTLFEKVIVGNNTGHYPDFGCNVECYINKNVLEIETLSPTARIEHGQSITHIEQWSFSKTK